MRVRAWLNVERAQSNLSGSTENEEDKKQGSRFSSSTRFIYFRLILSSTMSPLFRSSQSDLFLSSLLSMCRVMINRLRINFVGLCLIILSTTVGAVQRCFDWSCS